ncbi:MAG: BamA/TamA family outer membrane protein [Muribaculaceae bacterium]|nr:BamA/TamA family outer membrane protein [Muribaculaceae bacterium]
MAFAAAAEPVDSVQRVGFWERVKNYFKLDADTATQEQKRFDISIVGGPSYASDSKLGLGLAGIAQYRLNGCDNIQPSNATITGDITTAGFWSLGVEGTTFFPDDRMRLNYVLDVEYAPRDFWGMGYVNGNIDEHKVKLHEHDYKIKGEWLFRLADSFYAGPMLQWDYANSGKVDSTDLFVGQDHVVRNYGLGFTLQYDSRDLVTNAYSGVYLYLNQVFRPKFFWNHYAFSTTDFRACYYHTAWKGAVIAGEARALFNFGNPSWAMMALLGDSDNMRGYYHGRYRDKHMVTTQVELRQYIYRRVGAVLWGGAGSVFHDGDSFRHWLPNYGVGLRWEFRRRVNIRLDYGFGRKGQSGFIFNINEAF